MSARLPLLAVLLALPANAQPAEPDPFADCERRMTAAPDDLASSACFYQVASAKSLRPQARERLLQWLARRPGDPGVILAVANNESDLELPEAEERYRTAIAGFRTRGQTRGLVFASLNLSNLLGRRGQVPDAEPVLAAAERAATADGDRMLVNAVRQQRARLLWQGGRELGRAYRILREVEAEVFPDGHPITQLQTLHALGGLTASLGRRAEAVGYYRRLRELARGTDVLAESTALMRIAVTLMADLGGPDDPRAAEAMAAAREAVDLSRRGGGHFNEAPAYLVLGTLGPRAEAADHFRRCAEYAQTVTDDTLAASCLSAQADAAAATDPDAAVGFADRAVAAARQTGDRRPLADALGHRAYLLWLLDRRAPARAAMTEALDAVEAIRDTQRDDRVRLELLADRGEQYYQFAGLRLGAGELDAGWRDIERLRARTLLERLDAGRATEALVADTAAQRRRDAVIDRIQAIQRRLVEGPADDAARDGLLAELAGAEAEEAELRAEAAAIDPRFRNLRPRPATLAEVRAALADDEALLSYQLGVERDLWGRPSGGSWLVVVTRAQARAIRLSERGALAPAVDAFAGLIARGDSVAEAAARLHRELIAPALAAAGPGVGRLIIVPDGALFRLPFAALQAESGAAPLSATHELTLAPSATTWLRLRARAPAGSGALVLADPEMPAARAGASDERSWALATAAHLGRLPHARAEADAVAHHLGAATVLLLGADASEAGLKQRPLADYGIIHFAAHALVDDQFPDRSAVLLAPGAAGEDGLLQPREIAALDATGRVVVLSTCRSAAGEVLRGEGLVDLTRTFLIAGARAVVGSLWQVRDDDAEILIDGLYRHLAEGATLAAALALTQRELAAGGAPPSAWAGFVIVGDGSQGIAAASATPPPGHRSRWWLLVPLAAVGLGGAVWFRRRR